MTKTGFTRSDNTVRNKPWPPSPSVSPPSSPSAPSRVLPPPPRPSWLSSSLQPTFWASRFPYSTSSNRSTRAETAPRSFYQPFLPSKRKKKGFSPNYTGQGWGSYCNASMKRYTVTISIEHKVSLHASWQVPLG